MWLFVPELLLIFNDNTSNMLWVNTILSGREKERERETETETETDRQTDRQTGQADRERETETDRPTKNHHRRPTPTYHFYWEGYQV